MDKLQTYASSESDESGEECEHVESLSHVKRAKTEVTSHQTISRFNLAVPSNKQQPILDHEHASSVPSFQGYSSFMHMSKPETSNPPRTSIYGITKKQKQVPPLHHHRYGQAREIDRVSDYRWGTGHLQHLPEDISEIGHSGKIIGPDESRNVKCDVPVHQQEVSAHYHSKQFRNEHSHLKRQMPKCGLKPYVPKRLRANAETQDGDGGGAGHKNTTDIFAVEPFTSQSGSDNANKPPKRILCEFNLHEGPVTHVQWNIPQFSHLLLSTSMDKTVRLWDYSIQRRCVQTLRCHEGAVKDADWSADGRMVLSCGFDKTARLTDAQSGTNFQVFDHPTYVTCIRWNPVDPQTFISGTYGSTMYFWDTRTGEIVCQYSGKLGQILALEFINGGSELAASCDTVSRDSTDRTVMVWDTSTAALLSNQLYHEKYTCVCLKAHPTDSVFMAQSNADYLALFSTKRPYRLNKYQRFEGHQVEGYQIGCDFSPDGSLVASGSSEGKMYIYSYDTTRLLKSLGGRRQERGEGAACTDVAWHPVMSSVVACCSWDGTVSVWT